MSDGLPPPRYSGRAVAPERRRLGVALGTALLVGIIAAVLAHDVERSDLPVRSQSIEVARPSAPASPSKPVLAAKPTQRDEATDALRAAVDRYVQARADALSQLYAARRSGVDPDVLAAFGAVLGMPLDRPKRSEPAPKDAADRIDDPTDPRAL